jgi:hypothetical protein
LDNKDKQRKCVALVGRLVRLVANEHGTNIFSKIRDKIKPSEIGVDSARNSTLFNNEASADWSRHPYAVVAVDLTALLLSDCPSADNEADNILKRCLAVCK